MSLFDNNTLSEHREETVSTYNHLRVTAILNFCLRNNPARLLAAAAGGGKEKEKEKDGENGGCAEDGRTVEKGRLHFRDPCSGYIVIPRDVYRERQRKREKERERERE
ncbi:hypothetical protein ACS0PU_001717 [Formica fusca]